MVDESGCVNPRSNCVEPWDELPLRYATLGGEARRGIFGLSRYRETIMLI
jgi:hypothetical protein